MQEPQSKEAAQRDFDTAGGAESIDGKKAFQGIPFSSSSVPRTQVTFYDIPAATTITAIQDAITAAYGEVAISRKRKDKFFVEFKDEAAAMVALSNPAKLGDAVPSFADVSTRRPQEDQLSKERHAFEAGSH